MLRAIHYINQFFGGIGGENEANYEPELRSGVVGPGSVLQKELKDIEICHTIVCGDNFMASHGEEALERIRKMLENISFDIFIAGPSFRAGRYGVNCGQICKFMHENYSVPAVTSMHMENPGLDLYREEQFYIMTGSEGAANMRRDVKKMAGILNKLAAGETILWADAEGYFSHNIRREVFLDKIAADRAVDMLIQKVYGMPFETEYKIEVRDRVAPSPAIKDLNRAKIAVVSTGGLVPQGNPDRLPTGSCTTWIPYDISGREALLSGEYYSIHAGITTDNINADPEVLVPISALRELVRDGELGALSNTLYSMTGNLTTLTDSTRIGEEMAQAMMLENVDGALLVSL